MIEGVVMEGISRKVGNGYDNWFWEHVWISVSPLQKQFPRLFSISLLQKTPISDCGCWDGLAWNLELSLEKRILPVGIGDS